MKIPEIFHDDDVIISEAARFGRREYEMAIKASDLFRIGVEYEFNVNKGASDINQLIGSFVEPSKVDASIWVTRHGAAAVNLCNMYEEIRSIIGDLQLLVRANDRQLRTEVQEFIDFGVYDDVYLIFKEFSELVINSPRYNADADVLSGFGFPSRKYQIKTNSRQFQDIGDVYRQLGNDNAIKTYFSTIVQDLHMVLNYIDKDGFKIKNPSKYTGVVVIDSVMSLRIAVIDEVERKYRAQNTGEVTKLQYVKDTLKIPKRFIENILLDPSVPEGVEVVTKPLSLIDTMTVMVTMFDYIEREGNTNHTTGLHLNVSMKGFSPQNFNATKAVVLLDPEYFQTKEKYPIRNIMVNNVFSVFRDHTILKALAQQYINSGDRGLIASFERIVEKSATKMRSVNLAVFFNNKVKATRRIEFRFFGGNNYEKRYDELKSDLLNILYVMMAGNNDTLRKEYLRGIIRMLDKATMEVTGGAVKNFVDIINVRRYS